MVQSAHTRHLGADALLGGALTEVGAPRPDGDDGVHRRVQRIDPHLPVAAEDERTDVAGGETVGLDHVLGGPHKLFMGVRHRHVVELGRALQPPEVLVEAEDGGTTRSVVAADALEDAVAKYA